MIMASHSTKEFYIKEETHSWKREEDAVRRYWEVINKTQNFRRKYKLNYRERKRRNMEKQGERSRKNYEYYKLCRKYKELYNEIKKYEENWLDNWKKNRNKIRDYQIDTHKLRERIIDFNYGWYMLSLKYKNKNEKLKKIKELALLLTDINYLIKIRYNLRINNSFKNISEEKKKEIDDYLSKYINSLHPRLNEYVKSNRSDRSDLSMMYLPTYSVICSKKLLFFINEDKNKYNIVLLNTEKRLITDLCFMISKKIKEKWRNQKKITL